MATSTGGPAELVLAASVARRFYIDDRSKTEIAEEFALSRFKVARLLEVARAKGIVRIEIGHPGELDLDLSDRLCTAYSLEHAWSSRPRRGHVLAPPAPRAGQRRAAHGDPRPR